MSNERFDNAPTSKGKRNLLAQERHYSVKTDHASRSCYWREAGKRVLADGTSMRFAPGVLMVADHNFANMIKGRCFTRDGRR